MQRESADARSLSETKAAMTYSWAQQTNCVLHDDVLNSDASSVASGSSRSSAGRLSMASTATGSSRKSTSSILPDLVSLLKGTETHWRL